MMKSLKFFLLLFSVVVFASCSDSKLAKELEGSWQAEYTTTYSEGNRVYTTETATFTYDESSTKDDGTFVEIRQMQTDKMDYGDGTCEVKYSTSIEGRYSVIMGDLYMEYDLSTLQVNLSPSDVKIVPGSLGSAFGMIHDAIENLSSPSRDIARTYKKEAFSSAFEMYQNNSDAAFKNLKIEGNVMSYDTEEQEGFSFTRIQ